MLAAVRLRLMDLAVCQQTARVPGEAAAVELVFFQHDELVFHCPRELAEAVADAIVAAARAATDLLFPGTAVRFQTRPVVAGSYA